MINAATAESMIEKLERSAASERSLGNFGAAEAFDAKASSLRRQFTFPEAVKDQQTSEDKAAALRAAFTNWLSSIPLDAEVVVDDVCGGMQRTMPLRVVVDSIKNSELLLIKTVDKKYAWQGPFKEYAFFKQEVAEKKETEKSQWLFV